MGENGQNRGNVVSGGRRKVVVLLFPDMVALDAIGPLEAFKYVSLLRGDTEGYDVDFVGLEKGPVESMSGAKLVADYRFSDYSEPADMLLVPGMRADTHNYNDPALLEWVREQAARSARLVSVCSGAYVFAAASLFDDAEITTHWMHSEPLQKRYPKVKVCEDRVHLKSGNIYSSGGVTAGVDLALSIIAEDYDQALALKIAKRMVVYLRRPGNQAQYSDLLAAQSKVSRFTEVIDWIEGNLSRDINIEVLSDQCGMSPRNFTRSFGTEVNMSPMAYVKRRRLERSKHLLEGTDMPYGRVAEVVGFMSAERFSKAFKEMFDINPSEYRARFGSLS